MSENAREPAQKRQRFAILESKDLDNLLDTAQAQSTKYNTAYAVSVYKGMIFKFYFVFEKYFLAIFLLLFWLVFFILE